MMFYGCVFTLMITLLILYCIQREYPYNYIVLIIWIIELGAFFGISKSFVKMLIHLHFFGMLTLSLFFSCLWYSLGITPCVGRCLQPKYRNFVTDEHEQKW